MARENTGEDCSPVTITGVADVEVRVKDSDMSEVDGISKSASDPGRTGRMSSAAWCDMVRSTFGYFAPLAALSYCCNAIQFSQTVFAAKYYMMDELELDGPTIGRLMTASTLSYNIKPILAVISDTVPLFGYHRTSYLVGACALNIAMYVWVGSSPVNALGLLVFMTCVILGIAISDIVVDAAGAKLAKNHPSAACDLQSILLAALSLGGMAASSIKGVLVHHWSPRGALLSNVLCPSLVVLPALRGWLPEERKRGCSPQLSCNTKTNTANTRNTSLTVGSIFLAIEAVTLSLTQTALQDWRTRLAVVIACAIAILITAYMTLHKISRHLWTTAILLFVRDFFQPSLGESMFVWLSKDAHGPLLDPEILGVADLLGQMGMLLGIFLFNRYLRKWKFRNIFLLGQILVLLSQFLDLALVMRWNRKLGIPDVLFFLGDASFDLSIARTFWMPCAVLAYKVCPSFLEATLLANLSALTTLGIDCGKYLGVCLAEFWQINESFEHLPHGVVSKAVLRLLPIPFIFLLSPTFAPDDPVPDT